MSLEADKKKKQEPVIIEVQEYDNIKIILSKIVVPFSEIAKELSVPDLYTGCENIPFENRDPLYKSVMRQEFEDVLRSWKLKV